MWGWLRRRRARKEEDRLVALENCCSVVAQEWLAYRAAPGLKNEMPLHAQLGMFVAGMADFITTYYPKLVRRNKGAILTIIMIAVYRDEKLVDEELGPAFVKVCKNLGIKPTLPN